MDASQGGSAVTTSWEVRIESHACLEMVFHGLELPLGEVHSCGGLVPPPKKMVSFFVCVLFLLLF